LDALVAQRPAYAWRLGDGVYNLYPRRRSQNLSELRVQSFVVKELNLEEASKAISKVPEFQKWLSGHRLTRREFQVGPSWKPRLKVSLELKELSLREVLNEMVKRFGVNQWVIVRYGGKMEYVAIYFYEN